MSAKKRTILAGRKTYILDENETTPRNATLAKEVIAEAQKLVENGYNARFTCENKLQEMAVTDRINEKEIGYKSGIYKGGEYDLACQVIDEAKRIVAMGYNAKIGCSEAPLSKKERAKRREYYKWKKMNR